MKQRRKATLEGPPEEAQQGPCSRLLQLALCPGEGPPQRGSSAIPHPGSWHPPAPNKRLQPNLLGANDLGAAGTLTSAPGPSEWGSFQGWPGPEGQAGEGEPGSHVGGLGSQPTHGDREGVGSTVQARAPMLRLDCGKDFPA